MITDFICVNCKKTILGHTLYRGLCWKCYGISRKMVKEGKATWEELESQGKSLPKKKRHFKKLEDAFHREYINRSKNE